MAQTPVDDYIINDEYLRRATEELDAGLGIMMTEEEFDILSEEPLDGPMHKEIQRRRAELQVKLREWRAAKGYDLES